MNAAAPSLRFERLDALRGVALVWMAGFHFCFDLRYFGFIGANFYDDPFWTCQRMAIVSLFLLCAGMGQAVALAQVQTWPRFWRRWGQIAACALTVTIGSLWMFPRGYITFGVLHAMVVMLLLMRWLGRCGVPTCLLLGLGAALVLAPQFLAHPFFDTRWTNWVGLVTHKPPTEDFVPLMPWGGVMLWGFVLGRWTLRWRPAWLSMPLPWRAARALSALGRWSLSFYMVHQLLLISLVAAVAWLVRG